MDAAMPIILMWPEIKRLMEIRGIGSREALAKEAGISYSTLAKLEAAAKGDTATGHKASLAVIGKLCKALRCKPGDILDFVED